MSRLFSFSLMALSGAVVFLFLLVGCKSKPKEIVQADPKFLPYISSYTSGTISSGSTVKVRLTEPSVSFAGENTPAVEPLFDFSPGIEG
jgi:alpha-2-macroglobulin